MVVREGKKKKPLNVAINANSESENIIDHKVDFLAITNNISTLYTVGERKRNVVESNALTRSLEDLFFYSLRRKIYFKKSNFTIRLALITVVFLLGSFFNYSSALR